MPIRPARTADIEKICAFDHIPRRAFIETALAEGHLHVAEQDGEILGYVILAYSFFELGFVELLYVHPNHRRKGIGAALMQYAEGICTTKKIFTSTNLSNTTMQSLLMKLGYEESGIVHGLDEGDPELFYRKVILPGEE
jgi:GNAT superfamily N-acetyltransferase